MRQVKTNNSILTIFSDEIQFHNRNDYNRLYSLTVTIEIEFTWAPGIE